MNIWGRFVILVSPWGTPEFHTGNWSDTTSWFFDFNKKSTNMFFINIWGSFGFQLHVLEEAGSIPIQVNHHIL